MNSKEGLIPSKGHRIQGVEIRDNARAHFGDIYNSSKSPYQILLNPSFSFQVGRIILEELLTRTMKHKVRADSLPVTSELTEKQWQDNCLAALFLTDPLVDRASLITTNGQRAEGTCH